MENINVPCSIRCYEEEAQLGLKKAKVYIMHEGTNRNNTSFSIESMKKAEETIKNRPLLAYIETDENGEAKDFTDHRRTIKKTKDGYTMYYLETPVGVFPESCNARYEDIGGVTHFVADCYIWENYSNEALDLIEEANGEKQVSMEICVDKSEALENGVVDITDYTYTAVTILGDTVTQGMNGTCGLELFSQSNSLEEFTKNITTKIREIERGETQMDKDIFGLGASELERLVRESLSSHTYVEKMWGEEYELGKYGYVDVDTVESTVIARDYQNGGTVIGIPFSLKGEEVVLETENTNRYVAVWKKVEGEETIPEIYDNEQFAKICNEKVEALQEAYSKEVAAKEELKTKYNTDLAEFENLKSEVEELKAYKSEKEKAEKLMALEKEVSEVIAEFDLKAEELTDLTEKVYSEEMTVSDFKKELFVMEGMKALEEKKKAKFTKDKKAKESEDIAIKFSSEKDEEAEAIERKRQAYGGIFRDQI